MLRHLRVTNFAILSDVSLDFGPGLNVLTGETGAGKSLVVDAVNLLRGGRASADIPRAGTDEAVVEAVFEVPEGLRRRVRARLEDAGLPGGAAEPGGAGDGGPVEILVRRLIHRGGKSRVYVNGALTTASRLAELGGLLVDLSGQHQHQGLVDPRRHREILDELVGRPELVRDMAAAWQRCREIDDEIERLSGPGGQREDRIEFLRYQLEELSGAGLAADEDQELSRERARLGSVEKLESGARAAEQLLYGGDGAAIERLDAASRELERLLALDDSLAEAARTVTEARALVEDAAGRVRSYADRLEPDPGRLAEIEDRLALIARLKRKHGGSLAEVMERAEALESELDQLSRADERLADLTQARTAAEKDAGKRAQALSAARREAAARLEAEVGAGLSALGMKSAALSVRIEPRPLGADGADQVELMLRANRGEDRKPLAKVASGGELSRIMLALKLVLQSADPVATYVFDEVDTGIGGATAEVVGQQIRAVAGHRQVLCVTHLPQIAALADRHYQVSKAEVAGRTETSVLLLDQDARTGELARMVGGLVVTAEARAHAEAMLAAARAARTPAPARRRARAGR